MSETLDVRRYRVTDADAVWDVHEAAFRASPLEFVEEAAVDEDLLEIESAYLDGGGEFLVGKVDGAIVAVGGYLPVDDETVEIERMRVDPDHQRRGYASRLLDALEERARNAGFRATVLETIEPLRAARAFYEDAGYEVVSERIQEATGDPRYRHRKEL